ncbi:MAG: hypothetical protein ACFCVA_13930 [Gammaproteobacteria bacterium]
MYGKQSARLIAHTYRAMQAIKDCGFQDRLIWAAFSVLSDITERF